MRLEDEIKQHKFKSPFHKAMLNIRFTGSWLHINTTRLLKPYGISEEQFNVLRILKGQYPNPSPLQLIAERMLNRMSNTTRLVEKLRQQELVTRKTCVNNRRKVDILITEKGLELLNEIQPLIDDQTEQIGTISAEEAEELNRILDKLRG